MRRGKRKQETCDDRISKLSDDILISILSRVSLKQAVRASVLSKRWRYLWCCIPHLEFGSNLVLKEARSSWWEGTIDDTDYLIDPGAKISEWMSIVRHILCSRQVPILSCSIYLTRWMEFNSGSNELISLLAKNRIQNLHIDGSKWQCQFPPNDFYYQNLKKLTLTWCEVVLPSCFEGMSNLTSLKLFDVSITDDDLEKFISSCRMLVSFSLHAYSEQVQKLREIKITAPNLVTLSVDSSHQTHIYLKAAPLLADVRCSLLYIIDDPRRPIELLKNLSHVESLALELPHRSSEFLCRSLLIGCQLLKLKKLTLYVPGDSASFLSCILRRSPCLQELNIMDEPLWKNEFVQEYWETQGPSKCLMHHLLIVDIKLSYLNSWCGIGLIKFLLENACVLRRMIIGCKQESEQLKSGASNLLLLKRASPDSVLEFRPFIRVSPLVPFEP